MSSGIGILSADNLTSHEVQVSCGARVYNYFRPPSGAPAQQPVLVLVHGYPQTSYMWRKLIKLLPQGYPLFIPDLPGYGRSTPSKTTHDKRTVGHAVLEALLSHLGEEVTGQPIYLCGHDRGSRVCHRLCVDYYNTTEDLDPAYVKLLQKFKLSGTILLDTVPEIIQFGSFASPAVAAGTFHWPFLANVQIAYPMITAYGGGKWAADMLVRWTGKPNGPSALKEDGGFEAYCNAFDNPEVVRASCEDYAAGAGIDSTRQEKDQAEGRKLNGKVLSVYSKTYLGSRYDMEKVWEAWSGEGCELKTVGIGGTIGHFIPEESPEELADLLKNFMGI